MIDVWWRRPLEIDRMKPTIFQGFEVLAAQKEQKTRFSERIKCFLAINKTEDYEFNHCDDMHRHIVKSCVNCGIIFRKNK